jgi:nanoRNase/pAp phosphatase (c-di-AMP/oligoRNAs hydrolase)
MYLEGMRWSLAFGEYEDALYYSVRTSDRRMNAGRIIRDVIEAKGGSAGGHGTMAGARLPTKGLSAAARKRLREEVVRAFLEAFGVRARKGKKLV